MNQLWFAVVFVGFFAPATADPSERAIDALGVPRTKHGPGVATLSNPELMYDIEEGATWSDIGAPVRKRCGGINVTAKEYCQDKWPSSSTSNLFLMKLCIMECQDRDLVRIGFGTDINGGIADKTLAPEEHVPPKWEFSRSDVGKEMKIVRDLHKYVLYTRINQGVFSKTDEGQYITVSSRKILVNGGHPALPLNFSKGTRWIPIWWLNDVTDGKKKITNVNDDIGGTVSLEGGRESFKNPPSSKTENGYSNPECDSDGSGKPPEFYTKNPDCYQTRWALNHLPDLKERFKGKTIVGKITSVTEGGNSAAAGTLTIQYIHAVSPGQVSADALVVTIGSSSANTKNISNPAGHKCPSVVGIWNRVHDVQDLQKDRFLITQSGAILSAKRLDRDAGWNIDLKITCELLKVMTLPNPLIRLEEPTRTPAWKADPVGVVLRPVWPETQRCGLVNGCVPCDQTSPATSKHRTTDGCFVPTFAETQKQNKIYKDMSAGIFELSAGNESDLVRSVTTVNLNCDLEGQKQQQEVRLEFGLYISDLESEVFTLNDRPCTACALQGGQITMLWNNKPIESITEDLSSKHACTYTDHEEQARHVGTEAKNRLENREIVCPKYILPPQPGKNQFQVVFDRLAGRAFKAEDAGKKLNTKTVDGYIRVYVGMTSLPPREVRFVAPWEWNQVWREEWAAFPGIPTFSNEDRGKTVSVSKDGKVTVYTGGALRRFKRNRVVKWIGNFTGYFKKIIAVEETLGGQVRLDDKTRFENPAAIPAWSTTITGCGRCAESQWSQDGFTNLDVGKVVSIKGDAVKVGGEPRYIKWTQKSSSGSIHAKHHDCSGKIQSVTEQYKGWVQLEDGQKFENGGNANPNCVLRNVCAIASVGSGPGHEVRLTNGFVFQNPLKQARAKFKIDLAYVPRTFKECEDSKVCLGKQGLGEHFGKIEAKDLRQSLFIQNICLKNEAAFTYEDFAKTVEIKNGTVKVDGIPRAVHWGDDFRPNDCTGKIRSITPKLGGEVTLDGGQRFANPDGCPYLQARFSLHTEVCMRWRSCLQASLRFNTIKKIIKVRGGDKAPLPPQLAERNQRGEDKRKRQRGGDNKRRQRGGDTKMRGLGGNGYSAELQQDLQSAALTRSVVRRRFCTLKLCKPVCTTKQIKPGPFSYTEALCEPDQRCRGTNRKCITWMKLQTQRVQSTMARVFQSISESSDVPTHPSQDTAAQPKFKKASSAGAELLPGCYVKSPSNCPKQSSFSAPDYKRDIWGEANMNAANDKNTCLVTRKKEFDSWCGSSDTKMKFVPRQQRSSPTRVPSLAPTPPPTLTPMSPLPTPLPPRKSTSSAAHSACKDAESGTVLNGKAYSCFDLAVTYGGCADSANGAKIKAACPKSCNACPGTCEDVPRVALGRKSATCARLVANCAHSKFGNMIRAACPKTCKVCPGTCEDWPVTGFKLKTGGSVSCSQLAPLCMHSTHGPKVRTACHKTCKACAGECVDKNAMQCPRLRLHCASKTHGTRVRALCPMTCKICLTRAPSLGPTHAPSLAPTPSPTLTPTPLPTRESVLGDQPLCRNPFVSDPESWDCACHKMMLKACPPKDGGSTFDGGCYRSRLCHNPTVCKSWKDKVCSARDNHQFAEEQMIFSAWAEEVRSRASGLRQDVELDAQNTGLSDAVASHTADARAWTLTPTAPKWTLTPTADQACFADPEMFDCSCFEKMARQCGKEAARKDLGLFHANRRVFSQTECNHFFVCTHSSVCKAYKDEHCQKDLKLLKQLQKRGRIVQTC